MTIRDRFFAAHAALSSADRNDLGAVQTAAAEFDDAQAAFDAEQASIRRGPNKNVNGWFVALTPAEIAESEARFAAFEAARPAEALAELRQDRNRRLTGSDWTQLPDAPTVNAAEWKVYRQALRDLPQNTTYPNEPQWPTAPGDTP